MTTSGIFVGGVANDRDAEDLATAGVECLGFVLSPLRWNPGVGVATSSTAERLRARFPRTRVCICLSAELPLDEQLRRTKAVAPDFYLVDTRDAGSDLLLERLKASGERVILGGFALDHDDDPTIVADQMAEYQSKLQPHAFHVTLVPSRKSPLQWFQHEAGDYDEDLTIGDVQELASNYPLLVNVDADATGHAWFRDRLPNMRGFFLWLGQASTRSEVPFVANRASVLQIVRAECSV